MIFMIFVCFWMDFAQKMSLDELKSVKFRVIFSQRPEIIFLERSKDLDSYVHSVMLLLMASPIDF